MHRQGIYIYIYVPGAASRLRACNFLSWGDRDATPTNGYPTYFLMVSTAVTDGRIKALMAVSHFSSDDGLLSALLAEERGAV